MLINENYVYICAISNGLKYGLIVTRGAIWSLKRTCVNQWSRHLRTGGDHEDYITPDVNI